jgi:uncharacterized membrane protein YfcA
MKNFIVNLLSNRFGIVLAALNLCYFVSNSFTAYAHHSFNNFDKIILSLNLPAAVLTVILLWFLEFLFPPSYLFLDCLGFGILFFFVALQWLFIGWTAKAIARRIRPTDN